MYRESILASWGFQSLNFLANASILLETRFITLRFFPSRFLFLAIQQPANVFRVAELQAAIHN